MITIENTIKYNVFLKTFFFELISILRQMDYSLTRMYQYSKQQHCNS